MIVVVAIGAAMAFLGFRLAAFGAYALSEDDLFLGIASLVVGVILVLAPVVVLVSQVRSGFRRRG